MLLIAKVDKKNKITNSNLSVHLFFRREEQCDKKRLKKTTKASRSTILWSTILWTKINNALYLQKIKNYGQTICLRDRRLWRELYR